MGVSMLLGIEKRPLQLPHFIEHPGRKIGLQDQAEEVGDKKSGKFQ
jgi:hypothetical protein